MLLVSACAVASVFPKCVLLHLMSELSIFPSVLTCKRWNTVKGYIFWGNRDETEVSGDLSAPWCPLPTSALMRVFCSSLPHSVPKGPRFRNAIAIAIIECASIGWGWLHHHHATHKSPRGGRLYGDQQFDNENLWTLEWVTRGQCVHLTWGWG